eukprot:694988_1
MSSPKKLRQNKKVTIISNVAPPPCVTYNFREENIESWPASISSTPTITTNKSVAFLKSITHPPNTMKTSITTARSSNKPLLLIQMEDFIHYEMNLPSISSTPTITTNKSVAFLKSITHPPNTMKTSITTARSSNKPLLLIQMEDFIHYEMNLPSNQSFNAQDINESRLEVFRECFDVFISEFSTYQPVLTRIKNEYEDAIAQCLKKVHQVRITEAKLNTLQRVSKDKLNRLNANHADELQKRDTKIQELTLYINQMKSKHENIDNLLSASEKEQKRLQNQYKDAQRSCKTFYHEIKKMQIINEEIEHTKQTTDKELSEVKKQHKKISTSYESVVNDLKKLQTEMDKGPAISSLQIEEKDRKIKYFQDKLNEYKQLYQSLMSDHQNLLDLYDEVTKERQEQAQQHSILMKRDDGTRPVTPRPFWQKAVEFKFLSKELIDGKSTDEIMSLMLTRLNQVEKRVEALQSIATDDQLRDLQIKSDDLYMDVDYTSSTPKYLRYKGKIRKRRMPKRDVEKLLDAIWTKKYSTKSSEKMGLQDFLYDYFKCEYGIQSRVVETGYSMLSALERYRYDADCELFLTILNGELSEDVYRDQKAFLVDLHTELKSIDKKANNKISKTLSKLQIEGVIRKLCPAKNEQNMKKLLNALDLNDPRNTVRYELLFREDRDGNQGPFLEELRDQHLSEIQDYFAEIKSTLNLVMNQYQQVTVQQIEDLFKTIDPLKPQSEINTYLCTGFGVSMVSSLAKDLLISTDTFCKKLSAILIKRSGLETGSPSDRRSSYTLKDIVKTMKGFKKNAAS